MKDAINFYSDATASAQCEGTFKPCSNVMSTFAFFAKRIRAKQNTSTKNGSVGASSCHDLINMHEHP